MLPRDLQHKFTKKSLLWIPDDDGLMCYLQLRKGLICLDQENTVDLLDDDSPGGKENNKGGYHKFKGYVKFPFTCGSMKELFGEGLPATDINSPTRGALQVFWGQSPITIGQPWTRHHGSIPMRHIFCMLG